MTECPNCLEAGPFCVCVPPGLAGGEAPLVVRIGWRSTADPSIRARSALLVDYPTACEECERLNHFYDGKVVHFMVPEDFDWGGR